MTSRPWTLRICVLLYPLFVSMAVQPGRAQDVPPDAAARADSVIARFEAPAAPGCVVGVIRAGEFVYSRGYGMANVADNVPLTATTPVYVASVVKQFIAASVLLAADRGLLSLDADIRTYLPEMPEYESPITIRHLIHHTSGVRDMYTLKWLRTLGDFDAPNEQEAYSLLTRQRELNFVPGSAMDYTTSNYELLGRIVERVTGKPLWRFADEALFKPLGMTHTQIHHGEAHGAMGYHRTATDGYEPVPIDDRRGAYTTLADLLIWDRNFYRSSLGGPEFARRLTTPGTLNDGSAIPYAAGLWVGVYRGLRTEGHGGGFSGFRSDYVRFPQQTMSFIGLCNSSDANPTVLTTRLANIYLAGTFAPHDSAKAELPTDELQRLAGTYASPANGRVLTLTIEDGALAVATPESGGRTFKLMPLDSLHARSPSGNDWYFSRHRSDGRLRVEVFPHLATTSRTRQLLFEAVELVPPGTDELQGYPGRYTSDEVSALYAIALDGHRLVLEQGADLPALPLRPTATDTFIQPDKGLTLRFYRDSKQRVAGFRVSVAGVWSLTFMRQSTR